MERTAMRKPGSCSLDGDCQLEEGDSGLEDGCVRMLLRLCCVSCRRDVQPVPHSGPGCGPQPCDSRAPFVPGVPFR